jgi:hypothetical protein
MGYLYKPTILQIRTNTEGKINYRVAEKSPYTDQYGPNPAVSLFVVEPY